MAATTVATAAVVTPSQAPVAKTTLTIAISGDIAGWDPISAIYWLANEVIVNCYDTLVTYPLMTDANGNQVRDTSKIVPLLASSVDNVGGKVYTFHLNPNAKFLNGDPVTAQAVKDSLARVIAIPNTTAQWLLTSEANVTTPDQLVVGDNYTLTINLPAPNPMFLGILTEMNLSIVDVNEINKHGTTSDDQQKWVASNSAGSGPYYVDSYQAGNQLTLKVNPNYWGTAPYYTTVIYKVVPDAENRLLLLKNGDVDVDYQVPLKDYSGLKGIAGIQIYATPTLGTEFYWVGGTAAPWNNPQVREALAYAVPYDTIIDKVYYGFATRATSWMPNLAGHIDTVPYTYDLTKASSLLAAAGYPNGKGLPTITFNSELGNPEEDDMAIYIQASLAQIGITMNIAPLDMAAMSEVLNKHAPGFFGFNFWIPYVPDPGYSLFWTFFTGSSGCCNYASYSNAQVDKLLTASNTEMDTATRLSDFQQVQTIVASNPPSIPIVNPTWNLAMNSSVTGYSYYPDTLIRFVELSAKK